MLEQEDDPELDDYWLTANEWLTSFIKARDWIVVSSRGVESSSFQGPQYSEE